MMIAAVIQVVCMSDLIMCNGWMKLAYVRIIK